MHILFLSHYFPPEVNAPATRTYEHCKHWVEMGHSVTVISCVPNHPMGRVYSGFKNRFYHQEEVAGIKVIRLLTYVTANAGFFKRTLNYLLYMVMTILVAPWIAKTDVVVSTSPQFFNGLAGYFVAAIKRAPWCLEIRDLWPDSITAVGATHNKTIIKLLEGLERFVYRKADHIVAVTYSFEQHIIRKGADPSAITVIRNGVDFDVFKVQKKNQQFAQRLGLANKFVASYVGTHGMAHGLDVILDAAELCRQDNDLVFLMVGDGAEKQRLLAEKNSRRLDNLIMLDQQDKSKMPDIWSVSDLSLVLLKKQDVFLTVIPSKIFESMAMKKPIILGVQGEAQALIEEAQAGICIMPQDAHQLVQAVRQLQTEQDKYQNCAEAGYRYAKTHFDRSLLATQYEQVLRALIG